MEKDFQNWHGRKDHLHREKVRPFFHEREIWFCSLGANIGFEQDGGGEDYLRPVLVFKKFNNEILWVLPFTKKNKKGKYYFSVRAGNDFSSALILSQIRLIGAKRLQYKIGTLSVGDFTETKKRLKALLE